MHLLACLQEMRSLLEMLYMICQMNQSSVEMNTASWVCCLDDLLKLRLLIILNSTSSFIGEPYNGLSPLTLSTRNMFVGLPSDSGETELLC